MTSVGAELLAGDSALRQHSATELGKPALSRSLADNRHSRRTPTDSSCSDERERVPWLYSREHPRMNIGMIREIGIEAGGEAVENRAHLSGHARILRAREPRNLERPVAPIASHAVLSVHLGAPAECAQVIVLDTPEVVLCLRVGEAKRGRRIGFAETCGMP